MDSDMDKEMLLMSEEFGSIEELSYKDDVSLFSHIGEYSRMQPLKLDFFVLLVCLNGHGSLNIDGVDYRIDVGKMFVCKPHIIVDKSSVSLDFECRGMALSPKFIDQLGRVADGGWNLGVFLGKNPVLPLSDDDIELFLRYYDLLRTKVTRSPSRHQDAVMQSLFRAFMLEFLDVIDCHAKLSPPNFTSSEMLFRHFVEVLLSDYPRQRSVEHYASRLCVTPKYLSAVSKSVSGSTASEVINRCITDDVRRLLHNPDKSVKEISNELGFPNLSFFGKYVKRMLGMSPKAYRKSLGATAGE